MHLITLQELNNNAPTYLQGAHAGKLFVYPTDTIYGIGAIVMPEIIKKIDKAKQRPPSKHYSIIAPSIDWIKNNFDVKNNFFIERKNYQEQFPGRGLTLLLPLKNNKQQTSLSLLSPTHLIGVRLLDHPFQDFIEQLSQPFITTSCNISGTDPIINTQNIPTELQKYADYIIDGGILDGQASVVINYETGEILRK